MGRGASERVGDQAEIERGGVAGRLQITPACLLVLQTAVRGGPQRRPVHAAIDETHAGVSDHWRWRELGQRGVRSGPPDPVRQRQPRPFISSSRFRATEAAGFNPPPSTSIGDNSSRFVCPPGRGLWSRNAMRTVVHIARATAGKRCRCACRTAKRYGNSARNCRARSRA